MLEARDLGKCIGKIFYINRRLDNKILKSIPEIVFSAEQRKILEVLWRNKPCTLTDLSIELGLAKNTLTSMLAKLEAVGLIYTIGHPLDGRKKYYKVTDLGQKQKDLDQKVQSMLNRVFYRGFNRDEIELLTSYLKRIETNLCKELNGDCGKSKTIGVDYD